MHILLGLVLICIFSAGLSIGGLKLVKRHFQPEHLESHSAVANSLISVLGTLYSVLLGFLIAGSFSYHASVSGNIDVEANALGNVFRLARGLNEAERHGIRATCRDYAEAVIDEEWPAMARGETSPRAWSAYYRLWDQIVSVRPTDQRTDNLHEALLVTVQTLGQARRMRRVHTTTRPSPLIAVVLVFGSLLVVVFSYLFATEGHLLHATMCTFVTVSLSLILFLIYIYNHPFTGDLRIQPHAFELERELFRQNDEEPAYLKEWSGGAGAK